MTAKKAAKMTSRFSMEPMLPEEANKELDDLALALVERANSFAARVNPILRQSIGDLVRSMNCYYSNLIEGHDTLPIDIDRALADDYAQDIEKRNLQLEARAHIEVQAIIDHGKAPYPTLSVDFILWLHEAFCSRLPPELLQSTDPATDEVMPVIPGQLRQRMVQIGRHVPPEPEALPDLLGRFIEAYDQRRLSKLRQIIAVAAGHHRLAWIHPFLDGNGRVTRLLSHAWLRDLGIGTELWSVSRGLARTVDDYKARLQAADEPRRGDRDGRGNLTEAGLTDFCRYFLKTCVDQVDYMESLLEPKELLNRIEIWCEEEVRRKRLPKGSWSLLREAVLTGEFERGRAEGITGYKERQARTVLNTLIDAGCLVSPTTRSKVRLGFPLKVVERWLPLLYPGGVISGVRR